MIKKVNRFESFWPAGDPNGDLMSFKFNNRLVHHQSKFNFFISFCRKFMRFGVWNSLLFKMLVGARWLQGFPTACIFSEYPFLPPCGYSWCWNLQAVLRTPAITSTYKHLKQMTVSDAESHELWKKQYKSWISIDTAINLAVIKFDKHKITILANKIIIHGHTSIIDFLSSFVFD